MRDAAFLRALVLRADPHVQRDHDPMVPGGARFNGIMGPVVQRSLGEAPAGRSLGPGGNARTRAKHPSKTNQPTNPGIFADDERDPGVLEIIPVNE